MRRQLVTALVSFILAISFILPASAQDESTGAESANFLETKTRKIVTAIEINGNEFISSNTI
ncbi:MAG: hypothetical protein ISS27_02785, partial [Candidatus Omnitrophica bacterium]|nr:hypothetical protein [Candidatus Omnitrophota bacterium]